MMQKKEHLTKEGIEKIINIRAAMNLGLTPILKSAFSYNIPVERPVVDLSANTINSNWMSGFVSGEGCFFINLIQNKLKTRTDVQLKFSISQHARDKELIKSFIFYFDCGHLVESRGSVYFYVVKFSDIYNKVIPFFNLNNILGIKSKDFYNWCEAAELMKKSEHLNEDGLKKIIKIKQGMNMSRDYTEIE